DADGVLAVSASGQERRPRRLTGTALCLLGAGLVAHASRAAVPAETPNYTPVLTVGYGQELYHKTARCGSCHRWAGDGEGRPDAAMPHFDAYGYSHDKCYGLTEAEIGGAAPPDSPRSLQRREIEAIVNYLQAKVVGRGPPTRAECRDVNGDSPTCEAYPR